MVEKSLLDTLERFRDTRYRQIYWVEDKMLIDEVIQETLADVKPFGLEVGFGQEPTRLQHIDGNIPWLLVEPDNREFADAKHLLKYNWRDVESHKLPEDFRMVALRTAADQQLIQTAQTLVFRNLDYRDMDHLIPPIDLIDKGKRLVYIVSGMHAWTGGMFDEVPRYKALLQRKGFNPEDLILRPKNLPSLAWHIPNDTFDSELVFDFTKN